MSFPNRYGSYIRTVLQRTSGAASRTDHGQQEYDALVESFVEKVCNGGDVQAFRNEFSLDQQALRGEIAPTYESAVRILKTNIRHNGNKMTDIPVVTLSEAAEFIVFISQLEGPGEWAVVLFSKLKELLTAVHEGWDASPFPSMPSTPPFIIDDTRIPWGILKADYISVEDGTPVFMCLQPYSIIPAYEFREECGEEVPEYLVTPGHTDDEILNAFTKLILKRDKVEYNQTIRYNRDMLIRAIRLVFWKARHPHATAEQIANIPGRPNTFQSMQFYRPNYTTDKVRRFYNVLQETVSGSNKNSASLHT